MKCLLRLATLISEANTLGELSSAAVKCALNSSLQENSSRLLAGVYSTRLWVRNNSKI